MFATPSALDLTGVADVTATALLRLDPREADAVEYVRNTAAAIGPTTSVWELAATERDDRFDNVETGLAIGAFATLALVAASMLVSTLEQLRERRRPLSVLAAFGARRSTLALSVLWQTAVTVLLGLGLAVAGGLGLGLVLLHLVDASMTDWLVFLPVTGYGAAMIAAVTLLSLPPLWRMMRPDGLRTE
ncbi:hypothetical protein GCM10027168_41610 [Streptomyces capparidis]